MKYIKKLLIASLLLLGAYIGTMQAQSAPIMRFGLIADTQYSDSDSRGTRFYREAIDKLAASIIDINAQQVDFTINLGDFTDNNANDLDTVLTVLNRLNKPCYNLTGNHDYVGVVDNDALYKKLGMPHEYYAFKKGKWNFIMLNTNEISSYANIEGTWKENEYGTMVAAIEARKGNNATSWNGGISSRQLGWLTEQVASAEKNEEYVLIFSHHQLYPVSNHAALNDQEILEAIGNSPAVKAMISGHNHVGAFGSYNNISCITTEGMVETKDINAYAVVSVYQDQIILSGRGRAKSYRILLEE